MSAAGRLPQARQPIGYSRPAAVPPHFQPIGESPAKKALSGEEH